MSISYSDAFAFYDENKLLAEPIFKSDLRAGHFNELGISFIEKLIDVLYCTERKTGKYPLLKKFFENFKGYNDSFSTNNSFEKIVLKLRSMVESDNQELKDEFYNLTVELEEQFSKDKDGVKMEVRTILTMRNGIDLAQYQKGISGNGYDASLEGLLSGYIKPNHVDKSKTLGSELDEDIKTISERVNYVLNRYAISSKGVIMDNNIVIYSALDGYGRGEVFLEQNGKVISKHK